MVHSLAGLAFGTRLLALLVDGGCESFDQVVASGFLLGREREHFAVGLLRLIVPTAFERGVRHHRPCDLALCGRGRRLQGQHLLRHRRCLFEVLQRIQLLCRVGQHGAGARIGIEPLRETQGARHARLLQGGQRGGRGTLFLLRVSEQGSVAGVGALVLLGIPVGRLLVLDARLCELVVFVEQLGQQEVVLRRRRIFREGRDVGAIPAHRFLVVRRTLGLLRRRVVVAREFGQVRLHERLGVIPTGRVGLSEIARDAVGRHVFFLRLQRQIAEAGLAVDVDHAGLQNRRLRMQRMQFHEGAEGVGRVLHALLLDVELAQLLVHAEFVRTPLVGGDVGRNRFRALEVFQRQAGHAEGVFHQFAVGPRQVGQGVERAVAFAIGHLCVEHAEERMQCLFQPPLLEERPALHVHRPLVIRVALVALEHGRVSLLGLHVVTRGEEQFASAEMRFVAVGGVGEFGDQSVERLQRDFEFAALLVATRQLVQDTVVARVLRVGLEVVLVARDRGLVIGAIVALANGAAAVGAVHFQVAQATHGFGALRCARRGVEELAIGRDGLVFAADDALVFFDHDLARFETLDGGLVVGRRGALVAHARACAQTAADEEHQQATAWVHGPHPASDWLGRTAARPQSAPEWRIRQDVPSAV